MRNFISKVDYDIDAIISLIPLSSEQSDLAQAFLKDWDGDMSNFPKMDGGSESGEPTEQFGMLYNFY